MGRGGETGRAPSPPFLMSRRAPCGCARDPSSLGSLPRWGWMPCLTFPRSGQHWPAAGDTGHRTPLQNSRKANGTQKPHKAHVNKLWPATTTSSMQTASSLHSLGEEAVTGSHQGHCKPRTKQTELVHWPNNKTPGLLGTKAPAAGGVLAAVSCLAPCRPLAPCLHFQGLIPPFASSPPQATTFWSP